MESDYQRRSVEGQGLVSMRIDFYRYRNEIKQALLKQVARLDLEWDPFAASWLAYALGQDGFKEVNQPLLQLIKRLSLWADQNETASVRRSLGALCFLGYFLGKMDKDVSGFKDRVLERIRQLDRQESHKFSPVNDPEQVFPMALLVGSLKEVPQSLKDFLKKTARERMQGTLKRRILYEAVLRELGEEIPLRAPIEEDVSDPGDVIALVWCWERYGAAGERAKWWGAFESLKDGLSFDKDEVREGARILSVSEMALLYEALTRETADPDPNLLFELYPFHPRVKEIARKPFVEGNYVHAVFEATKVLEERLKRITGIDKTCRSLVQESLGGESPRVRFNRLQSQSEKDEQKGLQLIAEGICAAFRNPKGHEPMDASTVQINAAEALDQLAIISYILKRIDQAEVKQ